jgi:hypothetical protein
MNSTAGTVTRTVRLRNSTLGNPKYVLWLGAGSAYRTATNSHAGFEAGNVRPGDAVTLTLDARGGVVGISAERIGAVR